MEKKFRITLEGSTDMHIFYNGRLIYSTRATAKIGRPGGSGGLTIKQAKVYRGNENYTWYSTQKTQFAKWFNDNYNNTLQEAIDGKI